MNIPNSRRLFHTRDCAQISMFYRLPSFLQLARLYFHRRRIDPKLIGCVAQLETTQPERIA